MMKLKAVIVVFYLGMLTGFSQKDSLLSIESKSKIDTVKIDALFELSFVTEDLIERRNYLNQALTISKKIKDYDRTGDVLEEIGNGFYPNEVDSFHFYFKASFEAYEKSGNKTKIAKGLNNLGIVFWFKNELSTAISYYLKAMEINLEINNMRYYAINCLNISMLYNQLKDYNKAMEFQDKLEAVDSTIHGQAFWFSATNTKGIIYFNLKDYEMSKKLHLENLNRAIQLQDAYSISMAQENLGLVYTEIDMADSAIYYFETSLKTNPNRQDYELAGLYNNIASAWFAKGNASKSEYFYGIALSYGKKSNYKPWLIATFKGLAGVYKKLGKYKEAVDSYEQYISLNDSMQLEQNQEKLNELETKFQTKQKEQEIELLKKNDELSQAIIKTNEATIEQQNQRQFFFLLIGIVLVLLIIVSVIAFISKQKSNRLLQHQKEEIEHQHLQLTEKNNEILDSLNYAKRLQQAILPPENKLAKHLNSFFILNRPKDIVSGDFYWYEEHKDTIYLAVADCTGHGVPGALVSVVCANTLSRVVYETGSSNPAEILDLSRELIKKYFSQHAEQINDGMDISLLVFQKNNRKIKWAGANNPLVIIRNHESNIELIEIKPDKQPVGKFSAEKPFTQQEIDLSEGDILYLFSDGYQDQFGGENLPVGKAGGKKFKYSSLKELFIQAQQYKLNEQGHYFSKSFDIWKGKFEQVDDVCVIGVKI